MIFPAVPADGIWYDKKERCGRAATALQEGKREEQMDRRMEKKMEKKIGFIGCGNMGSAMIGGMTGAGRTGEEKASAMVPADQVMASCASETSARERPERWGLK